MYRSLPSNVITWEYNIMSKDARSYRCFVCYEPLNLCHCEIEEEENWSYYNCDDDVDKQYLDRWGYSFRYKLFEKDVRDVRFTKHYMIPGPREIRHLAPCFDEQRVVFTTSVLWMSNAGMVVSVFCALLHLWALINYDTMLLWGDSACYASRSIHSFVVWTKLLYTLIISALSYISYHLWNLHGDFMSPLMRVMLAVKVFYLGWSLSFRGGCNRQETFMTYDLPLGLLDCMVYNLVFNISYDHWTFNPKTNKLAKFDEPEKFVN